MATKRDFTQVAHDVFMRATGDVPIKKALSTRQLAGRAGGLKGGALRAVVLTPEQRSEIARVAAQARLTKS